MEKIFEDIKFKYKFRDYQEKALTMLEKYKNDKKIHVVAAPGAGKTILALELLLRIGKKALVFAPTIAIKEQWVERLRKDFVSGDKEGLISTDLENPAYITVITYQAMYAMDKKDVNIGSIIKKNNIGTIVLDEAHHLRKVWFRTLKKIIDKLDTVTTVSLTATPPYDNGNDFVNYMSLCGDIDAKITVPQLVKSNCLCPHQDYVFFNTPTKEQEEKLDSYKEQTNKFFSRILNNDEFIKTVALHDYIIDTENHVDEILDNFVLYVSMLSFLDKVNLKYPVNEFNKKIKVPEFDKDMLEILLKEFLFGDETIEIKIFKDAFKKIKEELNEIGSIEKKEINLKFTKELSDILLKNSGKLDSISKIIEIETRSLKEKLKLVVVTDFIKDEYYDIETSQINDIGVIPIFKRVLEKNPENKLAVLTGTTIIIPVSEKNILYDLAKEEFRIEKEEIKVRELGINFDYAFVEFESKHQKYAVNLITKLFEKSKISVLIGTVALIGEGWDAPFINSLVIASFVSSYVTSNQVRGRAIRIDKKDDDKVSNIWHLVCLEKDKGKYILGKDYEDLTRRFTAYDGLNLKIQKIDSGIERLNIPDKKYTNDEIVSLNLSMMDSSGRRSFVRSSWKNALRRYVPICKDRIPLAKKFKHRRGHAKEEIKVGLLNALEVFVDLEILAFVAGTGTTTLVPVILGWGASRCLFSNYSYSKQKLIKRICRATYRCMRDNNMITPKSRYFCENRFNGTFEFGLKDADTHEELQFVKAIKQSLNITSENRYIIKDSIYTIAVPEMFSKNKVDAAKFMKYFNRVLNQKHLIYTKTPKGRDILLKERLKEM